MTRLFRGAGDGLMLPVVQCDYQRCLKYEQLSQPEPYPQAARADLEGRKAQIAALYAAPQPRGWPHVTWCTNSSIYDSEDKDFCSWHHLRIYAIRAERNGQ